MERRYRDRITPPPLMPECEPGRTHEWEEFEPYCEDCGGHSGWYCPVCGEGVDRVWDWDVYDLIKEELENGRDPQAR